MARLIGIYTIEKLIGSRIDRAETAKRAALCLASLNKNEQTLLRYYQERMDDHNYCAKIKWGYGIRLRNVCWKLRLYNVQADDVLRLMGDDK